VTTRRTATDVYVGEKVRTLRQARGLTQSTVGEALGLTFQQIQKYEKGLNRISASNLHALAALLHVTPEYFFEGLSQGQASSLPDYTSDLVSHADAVALIAAFQRIQNVRMRKCVVAMIEELAPTKEDAFPTS
jgi:transcriptional regulator with XRE-family HTH domain